MNHRNVLLFVAIAYGLTWLVLLGLNSLGDGAGTWTGYFLTMLYRWGPAIAAAIVARQVYGSTREPLGLSSLDQMHGKWFFAGLGWALGAFLLALGLIGLLGNAAGLPGLGKLDLDSVRALARVMPEGTEGAPSIPDWMMNMPGWSLLMAMLLIQFLLGSTLYLAYTYGEELGWRGFLLQETKVLGYWKGNLVLGLLAGIWYLPFVIQGDLYAGPVVWGCFTMVVFQISLTFPLTYFARKSGHPLTAAAIQGIWGAVASILPMFLVGQNPFVGSMAGVLGMVICWLTTAVIAWRDPMFIQSYPAVSYQIPAAEAES